MHPVLMSLGAFLFLGEGLVCYRNKFLMDSFSPIMAKGKRTKNRALHHGLQSFTLVFLLLGLLFIWASEIKLQGSVLPRTVHSFCGYVTILAVLTQAGQGMRKLFEIENKSSRQIKSVGIWHADFGLLIWDFICFTIILGAGLFLGIANASLYVVVCIVGVTWVSLHMQMRRKGPDGSQSHAFLGPNNQTGAPTSGDDSALDSKEACTSLLVQPEEDFSL